MQLLEINTTIAGLTSIYDKLNSRWMNDPCTASIYQAFRQTEYHEAYEKLKDFDIENMVLGIITNSLDEKILIRLRNLLNDNIQIYERRQDDFASLDFHEVYTLQEERLFADKFSLLANDRETIQDYPYPSERERQMLLKENQQEKNLLENERNEYVRANTWMTDNFYSLIYEISKSSLSIIESYFPVEKEENLKDVEPTIKTGLFFDMQLVSLIHNECNNIQFENLSELNLYTILNLQSTNARLITKPRERTRMCYLIYRLYEWLKTDNRTKWRTAILESARIEKKYYDSKYKEPESEIPSQKSGSFAQRINKIFENLP